MFNKYVDYRVLNMVERAALLRELLNVYEATTAASRTLLVFQLCGRAYATWLTAIDADMVRLDRESSANGGWTKLKFHLTNAQKVALIEAGAEEVGNIADILSLQKNKGNAVECWATRRYMGIEWSKDSIPYYVQGDIQVNGEEIQVKFENASLTNTKVMAAALEWKLAR